MPGENKLNKSNHQRLALDIGTNSIGWALYGLKNKKPHYIVQAGVRIFPSGRNPKDYTTLNATRRQARLERRQRDRYLQRRTYLLDLLEKHGLFPADKLSAKKLAKLNPYELRARGLDEKLHIHHFGRALFHLNQRRGFKSNRKSGDEKENGIVSQSVKSSEMAMEKYAARTYGEFLWKKFQKMEKERRTPGSQQKNWILARRAVAARANDNYVVYATRAMLEEEFNKLWDLQARFHKNLKNENLKQIFFKAIFYQRPLKASIVGTCEFTGEKRISKAIPSFQRFRILKELNNLSYSTVTGRSVSINSMKRGIEFRNKVIKDLFQKKKKIKFSELEKVFKKFFFDVSDFSGFSLNTENRDFLEGDQTSVILRKIIPEWDNWSLEDQDHFVKLLEGEDNKGLYIKEDEEVLKDIQNFNKKKRLGISKDKLKQCIQKSKQLPGDHGKYSRVAIQKLLPFLEEGKLEFESLPLAGLGHHSDRKYSGELLNYLPAYQKILGNHCVEMKHQSHGQKDKNKNEGNKYKTFRIPNPTIHIALNQLRLLVNDIIKIYGKPQQVVVETARDLPLGQKTKSDLEKKQKQNKKKNEETEKMIKEFKQKNNRANRLRYQLWIEQDKTCVYSGRKIPKNKLYTSKLEVDHILPWSKTLDDSFFNKVLVYKSSNQNKGSQTPYEYFSSNEEQWKEILQRVHELPKNKRWRFIESAMDRFNEEGGFLARQLNDTRYISRYAKQYLETILKDVWTVRGQTTSLLRYVLQYDEKSRDDHRNHAKDALIIGLVDRSFVHHTSRIAKTIEGQNKERLENIGKAIKKEVLPWASFREDSKKMIDQIIVSHRRRTKKQGQLHKETAYGVSGNIEDFSKPQEVLHYTDILSLEKFDNKKLDTKVVSEKIKNDFLGEIKKTGKLSKEFLKDYHQKTGIRRVRLKEKETVIPMKDKSGRIYKAFNGDGNYALELFEKNNGKWDARIIDTFTANQKDFKSIPEDARLMKGDMLFFKNKFWRLVKFDKNKTLIFLEHFTSGNPDNLRKDPNKKEQVSQNTPGSLQELNPKRVNISPCGIIKLTPFNLQKIHISKEKGA